MVILFKLKCYGISDCLFTLIEDFLRNRQQRVVLNGNCSGWSSVTDGVPQGSVLGPLFFLVYINDLVDNISSDAKLFADDTSLFTVVYDIDVAADKLNRDLEVISNWAHQWKMRFNPVRPYRLSFLRKKTQLSTQLCFSMGPKLPSKWSISI